MLNTPPPIYCNNRHCPNPINSMGKQECATCKSALMYRYLWAVGPYAVQMPLGELVGDRYYVVAPRVWLDTKPVETPYVPGEIPTDILPYLNLCQHRLHIPEVYGFHYQGEAPKLTEILLLDNVPVDPTGHLYPELINVWSEASAVRQAYWLWQMTQLWQPLTDLGLGFTLFTEYVRVADWRLHLLELDLDGSKQPTFQEFKDYLANFIGTAQPSVKLVLEDICYFSSHANNIEEIATKLNKLLLMEAAQLPLSFQIAGATDTGPTRSHNEDNYFPTNYDLGENFSLLTSRLAMICDGVGGHDGGEVASQLAIQSLHKLIQSLYQEIQQQSLIPPEVVSKQIEGILRVVNNLIAAENDIQGRELRQRMGTTAVMALQIPQEVKPNTDSPPQNSHELYIANVGDSRAYWLTELTCIRLTADDDVATREVRLGKAIYTQAIKKQDGGALVQALGTRDGVYLRPSIQRLVLESDGLLLLCSDGLSDHDLVEKTWQSFAPAILQGKMSLRQGVKFLIDLANTQNGHDNTTVILIECRISPPKLAYVPMAERLASGEPLESELSEASKALLYGESVSPLEPKPQPGKFLLPIAIASGLLGLMIGASLLWRLAPPFQSPSDTPTEVIPPTAPTSPPNNISPTIPAPPRSTQG
jgi:protein phosphatase